MTIEDQCIDQLKSDSYKIKMVNFFDRTVHIILQNDNGPCPLLAICVNGDTLFVTGNFEEFRVRNGTSSSWDEQNAMSSPAEYLASMDKAALTESMSSDLQLAIALQQQEFENQPQQHNSQPLQQPSVPGGSGLVTGPNVRRSPPSLVPRQEAKSKEKCVVM